VTILCDKIYEPTINVTNLVDTCLNFKKQVQRVISKVKSNQQYIYQTIGLTTEGKTKRDLLGKLNLLVQKTAHTLFVNYDESCKRHYTIQINYLSVGGDFHIHDVPEKLRVINPPHDMNDTNENKIENSITELKNQIKVIKEKESSARNVTGNMEYASNLINKIPIINSLINEYIIDANTLIEIIQNAKIGIVHSSILSPSQIITHLKEIKMTLPPGTDKPTQLTTSDARTNTHIRHLDLL